MNAEDVLKFGHQTVLRTLDGLSEQDCCIPDVIGSRSIKEILAHMASFEQVLGDLLDLFLGAKATPTLERYIQELSTFSEFEIDQRRDKECSQILDEYKTAHARVMRLIAQIPSRLRRQKGTLPWYGASYDLEDFLVYTYYGHKREHCAQISAAREQIQRNKASLAKHAEMSADPYAYG